MNKLIQTLTGITIGILFIICMMSCSQKSYPGYAKYKKYEKRIDCPANQMIKERKQKIFWYKIWH